MFEIILGRRDNLAAVRGQRRVSGLQPGECDELDYSLAAKLSGTAVVGGIFIQIGGEAASSNIDLCWLCTKTRRGINNCISAN